MSDLKRYMLDGFVDDNALFEHDFGGWVKYADVEQQQSQIEKLNKVIEAAKTACFKSWVIDGGLAVACVDDLKSALAELETPEATK